MRAVGSVSWCRVARRRRVDDRRAPCQRRTQEPCPAFTTSGCARAARQANFPRATSYTIPAWHHDLQRLRSCRSAPSWSRAPSIERQSFKEGGDAIHNISIGGILLQEKSAEDLLSEVRIRRMPFRTFTLRGGPCDERQRYALQSVNVHSPPWVKNGRVELVDPDTLVLIMGHARRIYLNGCIVTPLGIGLAPMRW